MIAHDFSSESTKSYEEAIMLALYAASEFLADMQDAQVFIKELRQADNGKDFLAILEVTKDPLTPVYTRDEFEDLHEKKDQVSDAEGRFAVFRKKGFPSMKAMIAEHFKKKGLEVPTGIPDFVLAPLTSVDIENDAIERDFMCASEALPVPLQPETVTVIEPENSTHPATGSQRHPDDAAAV